MIAYLLNGIFHYSGDIQLSIDIQKPEKSLFKMVLMKVLRHECGIFLTHFTSIASFPIVPEDIYHSQCSSQNIILTNEIDSEHCKYAAKLI